MILKNQQSQTCYDKIDKFQTKKEEGVCSSLLYYIATISIILDNTKTNQGYMHAIKNMTMFAILSLFWLFASISSSSSITVNICEWQSRTISCNNGQKIRIDYAMYGRLTRSICNSHNTGNTNCRSGSSQSVVNSRCNGQRSCSLTATNGWFGDPCVGIFKYLQVRYTCLTTDPCLTQYIREDNWQRSTTFNSTSSNLRHCDNRISNQWIRFTSKAGVTMPTKCPKPYACGTEGSIWLNGAYPTQVGQQTTVPVCVSIPGNCCSRSWNILLRKCNVHSETFYIHQLQPVPQCPMAYCAGSEVPCKPGYNSKTGFTPGCTKQYPAFTNIRLYHEVHNKRLQFICEFSSDDYNNNDTFEVTWYQSTPVKQLNQINILRGKERMAILRNNHSYPNQPIFHLGTTISCRVRSWFGHKNDTKSRFVESNHFYAGIKVLPGQLKFRLSEKDKPLKLMVTNTVPVVCQHSKNCFILVEIGQTNSDNFLDVCTLAFKGGAANQTKIINVIAKRDFVDDGDHTMSVKFHIFDHIDPVDWNNHHKIPDVQIISVDIGTERCSTTGDPHLTTFDKLYYNHYQVGDYVLVNSTCRRFEVHVRTWRCASVSCNCGVAVREGDDVVVVDMCRDKIPRARFASTVQPHKDTRIQRNRNGKSYMISFPSGAFVRVDMHRWYGSIWYSNIQVQVVSDDYKCTEGLCGTFDGNQANDMTAKNGQIISGFGRGRTAPTQFSESWRLGVGKSLFYYKGGPRRCRATRVKHYCTCEERCCGKRNVKCDFNGYAKRPKYKKGFEGWKDLNFPGGEHCGKKRKRRSTTDRIILPDDDNDLSDYVYDPVQITPVVPQLPTLSGKTLASVKNYCENQIKNSDIAKICLKLIDGLSFDKFITECITDIQITDNDTFVMSAIDSLQNYCEEKSLKDITLWKRGNSSDSSNGTLEPPEEIANLLCPNQCSGNGKCKNATCICNTGFETSDCSLRTGATPVINSMQIAKTCDVRKRDCTRVRLSGTNFLESVKCRSTAIEITDKGIVETLVGSIVPGFLLSFAEIMCEFDRIPLEINGFLTGRRGIAAGGYLIDVSNDAAKFSENKATFLVYDSTCMNCSNSGVCIQKKDTCNVNGYCFKKGQAHPADYCQVCEPSINNRNFTTRSKHLPPVFHTESNHTAFKDQSFDLQLKAKDPENQTVTFELYENYEGVTLSSDGKLKWTPNEVNSYRIIIIAQDRCGAKSSLNMNINVMQCNCTNRKICSLVKNDTNNEIVKCRCKDGCTGEMCDVALPGKVCKIKINEASKRTDDAAKTQKVIISVSVVVILLILIAAIVGYRSWMHRRSKEEIDDSDEAKVSYSKNLHKPNIFENEMYESSAQLTDTA